MVLLLLTKTCFFLTYNSQTKRSIFLSKIMVMQNIAFILLVSFWGKNWKMKKISFGMCNDYGSKIHLIASKFFVEVDFYSCRSSSLGKMIGPKISEIFEVKIF